MRIVIDAGDPDAEEIAALATALVDIAASHSPEQDRGPAWARAAKLEAVGQAPLTSATDARLRHLPSRANPPA